MVHNRVRKKRNKEQERLHRYYCEHREEIKARVYRWKSQNKERVRELSRKWHAKNRKHATAVRRQWAVKNRAKSNKIKYAWRKRNWKKFHAHQRVQAALMKGVLKRGCCEVCGSKSTHAHHDDYSKVLEVRWLCPKHHSAEHRLKRKTNDS